MTEKSEYNYSLLNLEESIREVMEGEFTPQETTETTEAAPAPSAAPNS